MVLVDGDKHLLQAAKRRNTQYNPLAFETQLTIKFAHTPTGLIRAVDRWIAPFMTLLSARTAAMKFLIEKTSGVDIIDVCEKSFIVSG